MAKSNLDFQRYAVRCIKGRCEKEMQFLLLCNTLPEEIIFQIEMYRENNYYIKKKRMYKFLLIS